MITGQDILRGVLLPAAVAALVVLAGALFGPAWRVRRALVPLGAGVAFSAAFAALMQRVPPVPPLDSVDWLFYAALVIGAVAAVDSVFWREQPALPGAAPQRETRVLDYSTPDLHAPRTSTFAQLVRFLVVIALAAVLVWLLVRPLLVFSWTGRSGYYWIGGIALTMSLLWLALDVLARRAGGRTLALVMATAAALSALTILLSGSQKLGQLGGMLTAALFAVAVVGMFLPRASVARGMVPVYAALQTSLVVTASEHVYASLLTPHAILLLVAAPMAWLGQVVPARRPRTRAAVQLVAGVAPAAVAAILAARAFARAATDYSY